MSHYFTKFTQSGSLYYFAVIWKEQFSDVELILFHEGICYCGTICVKDFETLSKQAKSNLKEFWTQSLSIWNTDSMERKDLEVKQNDPSLLTLAWKKVLPNNPIKQRLGSINLIRSPCNGNTLIDYLINMHGQNNKTIHKLIEEQKQLTKNYEESLQKLEMLSNVREDIEKQLFSKFAMVLNQKKEKIRYLEAKLEEKETDFSSSTVSRKRQGKTYLSSANKMKKIASLASDDDFVVNISKNNEMSTDDDEKSEHSERYETNNESTADELESTFVNRCDPEAGTSKLNDLSDVESDNDQLIVMNYSSVSNSKKMLSEHDNDDNEMEETQELLGENLVGSEMVAMNLKASQTHADDDDEDDEDLDSTQELPVDHSSFEKTQGSPDIDGLQYLDDLI